MLHLQLLLQSLLVSLLVSLLDLLGLPCLELRLSHHGRRHLRVAGGRLNGHCSCRSDGGTHSRPNGRPSHHGLHVRVHPAHGRHLLLLLLSSLDLHLYLQLLLLLLLPLLLLLLLLLGLLKVVLLNLLLVKLLLLR